MSQITTTTIDKAVLVTGCSSGIGYATAVYLSQHGFTVFATVRKEADAEALRALNIATLCPVSSLDLAKPETIPGAIEAIEHELNTREIDGLYAIVNNAGGGGIAPIELMDVDKFRIEIEARILGPVELLQALLPSIRAAHGRILWIATPSLMPIPYVSSIHACDFAINCLARTLQIELKRWAIPNILIRCGGVKTAAPAKSAKELEADFHKWSRERFALYADALRAEQKELSAFDAQRTEPVVISQTVYKALTASHPKRRYQVGHMSRVAAMLEYLPQTWVDSIMERRG